MTGLSSTERPAPLVHFIDAARGAFTGRATDAAARRCVERVFDALGRPGEAGGEIAGRLPTCRWLDRVAVPQALDLAALLATFRDLEPLLAWRRRTGEMTGASAGFADAHANAMIAGPGGLERRSDLWLGVSLLAPGTRYPDHVHAPEEVYLVLTPGAFRRGDGDWFEPGVGGSFHNPPRIVHAMRAGDGPLLALWLLRAG